MMHKTILYTITGLGMGGAENQVIALADKFAEKGYSVHIAYITEPQIISPSNPLVKVHSLEGRKGIIGIIKAYWNLKKLIHKIQPNVVHSHMFHANILSRLARIFTHIPRLISTAHSNNEGGAIRMFLYRITDHLCDTFTNVSDNAAKSLENKGAAKSSRIITVLNGINCQKFQFQPKAKIKLRTDNQDKMLFLAVGRFVPAKDYPNLLHAFSILCEKKPDVELWIVGSGLLQNEIEKLIIQLRLSNNVKLLGIRKDIPALMSAADYFVLSSAWEGFGLVVAEAMACKTFVIATDCGGVKEVMNEHGILVQPKNSKLLAAAMEDAINLPKEEKICNNNKALTHVQLNLDLDNIVNQWIKVYTLKVKG